MRLASLFHPCYNTSKGEIRMDRIFSACAAVLVVALPACLHAGALLWQMGDRGKERVCYQMASLQPRVLDDSSPHPLSVWSMDGVAFNATAANVMQWDIWHCLQDWMVGSGRVGAEDVAIPTYRDLVSSGFISIGLIEMPELRGNAEL